MKKFFFNLLKNIGMAVMPAKFKGYRTMIVMIGTTLIGALGFAAESVPALCEGGLTFMCSPKILSVILMVSGSLGSILRAITNKPIPELEGTNNE